MSKQKKKRKKNSRCIQKTEELQDSKKKTVKNLFSSN